MSEHETTIVIHDEDLKEGYFEFGTSKRDVFKALCKKVGGEEKLFDVIKNYAYGEVTWWQCKVHKRHLAKMPFCIKTKRVLTEAQKIALDKNRVKWTKKAA